MSTKVALFAFNGEAMCFVHVLLAARDLHEKGHEVKIVLEGAACKLPAEHADPEAPGAKLYHEVLGLGLFDCICKACGGTMGGLEAATAQGIEAAGEMHGHPAMARYLEAGYQIITF